MPSSPSAIPYKTIMQIKYKPNIRFYDWMMSAAEKMSEYPDWETDRLSIVKKDFDKHCSIAITHDSITYEQDSKDNQIEVARIEHLLSELPAVLNIGSLTRLGYRQQYLTPIDMPLDSLVEVLNIKLFSQNENLRSVLPNKITDVMYRIDSKSDDYKYHIIAGPVHRKEIPRWLTYNVQHHLKPETASQDYKDIIKGYPEVALFLDIDMYKDSEQINVCKAQDFVNFARENLSSMADGFSNFIFADKLEGS